MHALHFATWGFCLPLHSIITREDFVAHGFSILDNVDNGQLQILRLLINANEIWKVRNQLLLGELHELNLLQNTRTYMQKPRLRAYIED